MLSGKEKSASLAADCGPCMEVIDFLLLALRITTALVARHRQGVPHGGIVPRSIFIPDQAGSPVLIEQGTGAGGGGQALHPEGRYIPLSGSGPSFAYLAPEQVRRLSQGVDCRADLYSLGVIFYELLTGQLPFEAKDPLEWAHCHIARMPKSPAEMREGLPALVSDIVMKLLSKAAEDRYQSAIGLQRDLEQCVAQWQIHGYFIPFVLGESDASDQLFIPHRLYGREEEISTLLECFERVAQGGAPELLLVAGYSGIGKTSLVRELYKPVVWRQGHFIWGKFDQYKRDIPYATIIEAFQELIRQLLAEREEVLAQWRVRLWNALGVNGQLIVDIIPQLEFIIGKQQPVAELPMLEAENRFKIIFCKFVSVFAEEQHPLVLFLDDLQWVDSASLGLLEYILTEPQIRYLLLIGAYRDNEVSAGHPLIQKLEAIRAAGVSAQTLQLQPLSFGHLRHLLADTFRSKQTQVDSLARLVYEKTGGNAFFTIQFLKTLHGERLVGVDTAEHEWYWDIDVIKTKGYADNVVDLMVGNLKKLRPEAQHILQVASCIGNTFNLATLAAVSRFSLEEVQEILWEVMQAGLVFFGTSDLTCAFLHDRVQQSAYSLIPADQRPLMHHDIGWLMIESTPPEMLEERIFDIVNQFNLGREEITDRDARYRVAELNLLAGRKAKNSSAYDSARTYFSLGVQFADEEGWGSHYLLMYDLYKELAIAQYVNSNYSESQRLIAVLLERAKSDLERAELFNILIVQNTLMGRYGEAIQIGKEALQLLQVRISLTALQEELEEELIRHKQILANRTIQSLAEEPEMTDPRSRVALELLSNMVVPSRYTDNTMFALISVLNVNLSLQYGPTPKSTVGYTAFGMFLNSAKDQFEEAYAFGELALKLSERFHAPAQKCQACFMLGHYLSPWVKPLKCSDAFNEQGIEAGIASGEMQWTGYTLAYKLFQPYYRGARLEKLRAELAELLLFTRKTKNQWATDTLLGLQLAITALEQDDGGGLLDALEPMAAATLRGESDYRAACTAYQSFGALGRFYVLKAQILYLFGYLNEALAAMSEAIKLRGYFSSSISVAELNFYHSLILAGLYPQAAPEFQDEIRALLASNQAQMQRWMHHCPENFSHMYHLVEAECGRINGREFSAGRLYDQAIREAGEQGFIHDEALANEVAGRFFLHNEFTTIARAYLQRAGACYRQWGAAGKIRHLALEYPWIHEEAPLLGLEGQAAYLGALDAISVVKASQAISGEIVIPDLIEILMQTVLENAGAQRGFLICERGTDLVIEAEAWIDGGNIKVRQPEAPLIAGDSLLPISILNYVHRSHENVILEDAAEENRFAADGYIAKAKPVSLLCLPVMRQARLIGMLYLENNLMRGAFSPHRVAVLELLSAQAAISLENAELYQQRSRTEEALRDSEAKYRTLFDNSGTSLVFIEEDMTISMVNKEFETLTGYRKEEVEGEMRWVELVANPDDLHRMLQYHRLRRTKPGAAPQTYECQLRGCHGEVKDVVVTVAMLPGTQQSLASILDNSGRKRAEAEQRRLVTAIEQTNEAVFITDTDFIVQYTNPAFERMCGYGRHEIIGLHARILESKKHPRSFYRNIRYTLEQGRVWLGQMTCTRKDGSTYEAEVASSPVRDKTGKIVNFVSTHKDVTHELLMAEELRQAQKMEAIGTLAGGIAHDFNNILTAIMGNVELIQLTLDQGSAQHRRLEQVITSCTRAADLVQQILTFSRKTKQERKPIHILPLIKETLKLLRSTLPATIEIRQNIHTGQDEDVVLADPTQIHQILMNLCTNAAHAIGAKRGEVDITLSSVEIDDLFMRQHPELPSGVYLCLQVSDTGEGMEPAVLERIFEPYFTTKGLGKGTGLGLAVVRGIVSSYGGTIQVASEPGKGTTFSLYFPVVVDSVLDNGAAMSIPEGRGKVLLIDDEEMLIRLGEDILRALGYQVVAKMSSVEALEVFREQPDSFDLVITDMTMPDLTGKDLAKEILRLRSDLPIILCTGYSEFFTEQQAEAMGIRAYVHKPYTLAELANVVHKTLQAP